jgi:hypothetical protein
LIAANESLARLAPQAGETARSRYEVVTRHSMYNTDRGTDLKIVVIGLACATVVAAVGIFSRVSTLDRDSPPASAGGQPIMLSGHCQPFAECDRVAPASGASRPVQLFGAGGGG